ncbi:MAG: hypothetical protein JWO36_6878, partial [Myxococcales bacterium]|nr:hypothetical protein [Myxococcales bacterium]
MTSLFNWFAAGTEVAQSARPTSEAQLQLPDLHQVKFLGMSGWNLLAIGLAVC